MWKIFKKTHKNKNRPSDLKKKNEKMSSMSRIQQKLNIFFKQVHSNAQKINKSLPWNLSKKKKSQNILASFIWFLEQNGLEIKILFSKISDKCENWKWNMIFW
jgi:hypothetical protein